MPPSAVFQRVFGIPPPVGMSVISAAGYAPFNGDAFLRFRAENVDAVLKVLKENPVRPLVGPDEKYNNDWVYPSSDDRAEWARTVGWESLRHAKGLEYYRFPENPVSGWNGMVVVDRRRKLFLVAAQIL